MWKKNGMIDLSFISLSLSVFDEFHICKVGYYVSTTWQELWTMTTGYCTLGSGVVLPKLTWTRLIRTMVICERNLFDHKQCMSGAWRQNLELYIDYRCELAFEGHLSNLLTDITQTMNNYCLSFLTFLHHIHGRKKILELDLVFGMKICTMSEFIWKFAPCM